MKLEFASVLPRSRHLILRENIFSFKIFGDDLNLMNFHKILNCVLSALRRVLCRSSDALANIFLRECGLQKSQCVNLDAHEHYRKMCENVRAYDLEHSLDLKVWFVRKNTKYFQDRLMIFEGLRAISLTHYRYLIQRNLRTKNFKFLRSSSVIFV